MVKMWNTRLSWSGEVPADYPELNPQSILRFSEVASQNADQIAFRDEIGGFNWGLRRGDAPFDNIGEGDSARGRHGYLNLVNPATQKSYLFGGQGSITPPSSGRILVGGWFRHAYTMTHIPLISTRDPNYGSGEPLLYLATVNYGDLRHQVYNSGGSLILDQFEQAPWGATFGWQWVAQYLDMDAKTSRILSVNGTTGAAFIGPVRSFTGTPNASSNRRFTVASLPSLDFYMGGSVDDVVIAFPTENFDEVEFTHAIARGNSATGQDIDRAARSLVLDTNLRYGQIGEDFETGNALTAGPNPGTFSRVAGAGRVNNQYNSYGLRHADNSSWQSAHITGGPHRDDGFTAEVWVRLRRVQTDALSIGGLDLCRSGSNGYQVVIDSRNGTGGSANLQIRRNNSTTPLATASFSGNVALNRWYRVQATVDATSIRARVYSTADTLLASATANNADFSARSHGIVANRSADFDNFVVMPSQFVPARLPTSDDTASGTDGIVLLSGSEQLRWLSRPSYTVPGDLARIQPRWSTDGGESWTNGDWGGDLPASFNGLVRWYYVLRPGGVFDGIDIEIPTVAPPTVGTISNQTMDVDTSRNVQLSSSGGWPPVTFSASSSNAATVSANIISGNRVQLIAGPNAGTATITITATDDEGQTGTETFTVTVNPVIPPPPTISPIASQTLDATEIVQIPLVASGETPLTFEAVSLSGLVTPTVTGSQLTLEAGTEAGDDVVVVSVTDPFNQQASTEIAVTVVLPVPERAAIPPYPKAPILLYGENPGPEAVVIDAIDGIVDKEVNGGETFTFLIERNHRHADLCIPETLVQVAGESYRIRRVTDNHEGLELTRRVYAEAPFYDLATSGQINGREWSQVRAEQVMAVALAGTGWTIKDVTVLNLRTYETEHMNPLQLLRTVQQQHGGELIFDNNERTVSLLVDAARDYGVSFFHGRGLSGARRVVDTTSLITRLYAQNADGQTIASVNNGLPYIENFTYTDEVKIAVYDFAAGTSPYTMLSMATATLGDRHRPSYSYEVTVEDLSWESGQTIDAFDVGDLVTVVDEELGLQETQRIVQMEYNTVRPWESRLTLSGRLRELGSSESTDAGVLTTGLGSNTFDLVPFNLLRNSRFDNGLSHWGSMGVTVVENEQGTSDYSARFAGTGTHWIEQTVQPDNRDSYSFSLDVSSSGPQGWTPNLTVRATVYYADGTSEVIDLELS